MKWQITLKKDVTYDVSKMTEMLKNWFEIETLKFYKLMFEKLIFYVSFFFKKLEKSLVSCFFKKMFVKCNKSFQGEKFMTCTPGVQISPSFWWKILKKLKTLLYIPSHLAQHLKQKIVLVNCGIYWGTFWQKRCCKCIGVAMAERSKAPDCEN